MAVLGVGGRLELLREAPDPCIITPDQINLGSNTIGNICPGYWNGDEIVISGPDGLPIFIDGVPQRWDGVASYRQDVLFVADNRDHIDNEDHQFYKAAAEEYPDGEAGDDAWFYYRGEDENDQQTDDLSGFICIDQLGRLRLYETRCEGLECCTAGNRLVFNGPGGGRLDFDFIVINPVGSADYQNAITRCFGEIGEYVFNDVSDNSPPFTSICADPPLYENPVAGSAEFDNANILPRGRDLGEPMWRIICDLREWTLQLDAPSVDTTGVGEKWGEAVKSLVSGGGSAEFFVDRKCYEETEDSGTMMMRLLLMTEKGCKAGANFYLIDRGTDCGVPCAPLAGDMYYQTEILITGQAINLRPTELVAATCNFVTTGEIRLLEGVA